MDWSKKIKDYRDTVLLTQTELANKLDVALVSVKRWEIGKFEPTMKMKRKLKKLFDEVDL